MDNVDGRKGKEKKRKRNITMEVQKNVGLLKDQSWVYGRGGGGGKAKERCFLSHGFFFFLIIFLFLLSPNPSF